MCPVRSHGTGPEAASHGGASDRDSGDRGILSESLLPPPGRIPRFLPFYFIPL